MSRRPVLQTLKSQPRVSPRRYQQQGHDTLDSLL